MKTVRMGDILVGEGARCFIIAGAGSNHNKDLSLAKKRDVIKGTTISQDMLCYKAPWLRDQAEIFRTRN